MTTKSERREAKRKKAREGKLMRGDRSVFTMWLRTLKRNRYYRTMTTEESERERSKPVNYAGLFVNGNKAQGAPFHLKAGTIEDDK